MIKTAKVIEERSEADTAGLYDTVEIYMENTGKSRKNHPGDHPAAGRPEGAHQQRNPWGRAVLGHRAGDQVQVQMENGSTYWLQIRSVEKGRDDGSIPIGSFDRGGCTK